MSKNLNTYTSKDGRVVISIFRTSGFFTAWDLRVDGKYKCTKVLPANNTAVPQNFDFELCDFNF